jgi:hypothetical protein
MDRVEDRNAERGLATLPRRDTSDQLRAVIDAVFGVKLDIAYPSAR